MNIQESLSLAQMALRENNVDKAKIIYSSILEVDPSNFIANTDLGIIYIQQIYIEKGLDYLKKALDGNPEKVDAWMNYIKYLMVSKKSEKALQVIRQSKIKGLKGDALDQLETICLIEGDSSFSEEKCQFISYFLQSKYQKILDYESTCLRNFDEDPSFNYLIAVSLFQLGLQEESLIRFKKSIELQSDLVDNYRFLVNFLYKLISREDLSKYKKIYMKLKSKNLKTKSNISNTIDLHLNKIESQDGIPSFFDNAVSSHINGIYSDVIDYSYLFESLNASKCNRFISYEERILNTKNRTQVAGLPFELSQGTHSLIRWKNYDLYKTTNDLVLYWMILDEIKPQIIVELGSGCGGSAVWMADISKALGFHTHIFSYDINKPNFIYPGVSFVEFDINKLNINDGFPELHSYKGNSKLFIEDAHVNTLAVLSSINQLVEKGDYLIIEDSFNKQKDIAHFCKLQSKKYMVDQFYLDFFGLNMTCSIDSIFRIY